MVANESVNRHLLLGLLALQNNFVSRETLLAAFQAWCVDRSKNLSDHLRAQAKLTDDVYNVLKGLTVAHMRMHDNSSSKSLAALSSIGSVRERLEALGDPEVAASLVHLGTARAEEQFAETLVVDPNRNAGARFRFLRSHARGGLGEVSVALDEELSREVALKEILPEYCHHPEAIDRFVREAEVTGQLEHPGIVPVYGLGTYADGRPFYAMRFIRGESFKKAIDNFHKECPSPAQITGEHLVKFRHLLGRFVGVCQAIHYAHSRQVLHRDLKPENIMLGKYGETLVVDWGLAKAANNEATDALAITTLPTLPRLSGGSATLAGSALGTPEYMSPEQAAGRLDLLGPATDIYALGATLYCLLTGRAPFKRSPSILEEVQAGDFPRPNALRPKTSKPLEAICLKAMQRAPNDRYASCQDLSNDIERWLADEPVLAYREPVLVRARRWLRKHPTMTAAVASSLVVLVGAFAAGMLLISSYNHQLSAANQVSEQRRLAAEEVTNLLFGAVHELGEAAGSLELHRRTYELQKERLGEQHSDSVTSLAGLASAFRCAGDAPQSIKLYQQVIDWRSKQLGPDHADTRQAEVELAISRLHAGQTETAISSLESLRQSLGDNHELTQKLLVEMVTRLQLEQADAAKRYRSLIVDASTIPVPPPAVPEEGKSTPTGIAESQSKRGPSRTAQPAPSVGADAAAATNKFESLDGKMPKETGRRREASR